MQHFKKTFLTVAVFTTATVFCFSQSYSITPNDTVEITGYLEDLQTLTISQTLATGDSIFLKWKKVSESVPFNWEATVCDNKVCYTSLVDSGAMNAITATENGFLLLHITAHVNYGTAIIRYAVWDVTNSSVRDTLTFILHVVEPSAILTDGEINGMYVYPNPINNLLCFTVPNGKDLSLNLFNSTGEKVHSLSASSAISFETSGLANGLYILTVSDEQKIISSKKIIIQH
ncbi:MAG: T9SS type A sorting domain-containing protein [Chitinophagales bacterium]